MEIVYAQGKDYVETVDALELIAKKLGKKLWFQPGPGESMAFKISNNKLLVVSGWQLYFPH